jgi:hypothetical protein
MLIGAEVHIEIRAQTLNVDNSRSTDWIRTIFAHLIAIVSGYLPAKFGVKLTVGPRVIRR